jgi:hypothetical protein
VVDFYVTSPSEENVLVNLETEKGNFEFFNRPAYKSFVYNYSEEDATGWVKIINNPVEIKPSNDTSKAYGGLIKGKEKISFIISVPKNAEPGYHVFYMKPVPTVSSEATGTVGSRIVAITSFGILLNIPGDASRKGVILDTEVGNYANNEFEIISYFQNTGTNTISARATQRIYDMNGSLIEEIYSPKSFAKPKDVVSLISLLPISGLSLGSYNVYTVVDYTTDKAEMASTIKLPNPPASITATKYENNMFIYLVALLIVILIIATIAYRRTQ